MTKTQIEIKWHRLLEAAEKINVAIVTGIDHNSVTSEDVPEHDKTRLKFGRTHETLVRAAENLPIFVIDDALHDTIIAQRVQFEKALSAMRRADLIHLPYPKMLIQVSDPEVGNGVTSFLQLNEIAGSSPPRFQIVKFSLTKYQGQDKCIIWPVTVIFTVGENPDNPDMCEMHMELEAAPVMGWSDEKIESFKHGFIASCGVSIVFSVMVWRTKGVGRIVRRADDALNKARVKNGKRPIPPYTVLKAVSYMDRAGGVHELNGEHRHMPIHWRCGHTRRVAYGKGRAERKEMWFDAVLVNYQGDETAKPKPKTYVAQGDKQVISP